MTRSRSRELAVVTVLATSGCGLLIGLEDRSLYKGDAVPVPGDDAKDAGGVVLSTPVKADGGTADDAGVDADAAAPCDFGWKYCSTTGECLFACDFGGCPGKPYECDTFCVARCANCFKRADVDASWTCGSICTATCDTCANETFGGCSNKVCAATIDQCTE